MNTHMVGKWIAMSLITLVSGQMGITQKQRPRDLGIMTGVMSTGSFNAITDVVGVKVGHFTWIEGEDIRTGVTAIIPHGGNVFENKVPAAIYVGNGFGKLAGITQVEELGNLETPILLTNTLSVAAGIEGLIAYTLKRSGNHGIRSVNALVGETNDGYLNNITRRMISADHVLSALDNASTGKVEEGNVGAGTGTVCFGYKGGIGTSSRTLPKISGGYTVGVLVQSNFGGLLMINGVSMAGKLQDYNVPANIAGDTDGSCMIVVGTDAPLSARNLKRLAKRAMLGLARTGGIASNGSGDYVIAFSTFTENLIPHHGAEQLQTTIELRNDAMSPLFNAVIEATEEAILNSMFMAENMNGYNGHIIKALPVDKVIHILKQYGRIISR